LYPALDKSLEGIDLEVTGQIVSIPSIQARSTRFDFLIHEASRTNGSELIIVPKKVRLNWYGKVPELQLGESWQLRVRLKRPWGFANPGSFDYEKWLFEHEIRATGYVRGKGVAKRLDVTGFRQPSHFIRAWLNQQLQQASSGKNTSVIKALALGEKSDMSPQRWKVLTETGTNHLLAISGLHVGLVSGFIYFLILQVWKLSEALCLRIAAQRVAAIGAIFASVLYALLAGFSIPTQRAMLMATVVFMAVYFCKSLRPWSILSIALFCVLVWEPFSVLAIGFWLSFLAVALIIFTISGKQNNQSWLLRLVRVQWVLALGLLPVTLIYFQQAAWVSPLANFFAVPWVSFVVVPLVLLGSGLLVISEVLGAWVLQGASYSIDVFWWVLNYLHNIPYAKWSHSTPNWALLPAALGVVLLLAPKGWPSKQISLVLLSPLLFAQQIPPTDGALKLSILDVGQGLATVLETERHVLVYDTGPNYSESFNAGEAVIVPYLRDRGIDKVDMLIVSHTDKDHAGGLESVLTQLQVDRLVTSTPQRFQHDDASLCRQGVIWKWDGVHFEFLHPNDNIHKLSQNHRSCVLLIKHSAGVSSHISI